MKSVKHTKPIKRRSVKLGSTRASTLWMSFSTTPPPTAVFFAVAQSGEISKAADDSKVSSTKIKIAEEIGISGLVEAAVEYVKSRTTTEHADQERATAGSYGAATAGDCGAATAGSYGAATAGSYGAATAGSYGAATAGDCGAATSKGSSSSGRHGLSVVRGGSVKARGGIGAVLVIAIESSTNYCVQHLKAVTVDGENVKADTWYTLDDSGELVEVAE